MADIFDTAIAAGKFKKIVTTIQAAGLVDTLKGPGPVIVFAPTDAAFASLPKGTVENLLKDIPKPKSILTYRVVAGKVTSEDVTKLKNAKTLQGEEAKIDISRWHLHGVKINDAEVVKAVIRRIMASFT